MKGAAHLAHAPHFVYRCFDGGGRLLYVGCTAHVERRFLAHRSRSKWFPRMTRVSLIGPFVGIDARHRAMTRESEVIAAERPVFNLTGTRYSFERHRSQAEYLRAERVRDLLSPVCGQGHELPHQDWCERVAESQRVKYAVAVDGPASC